MPVIHSSFLSQKAQNVSGLSLLPVSKSSSQPAETNDGSIGDIVEEALLLFRPNSYMRNFEVKGGADRTLLYLSLFIAQCLDKLRADTSRADASRILSNLAGSYFPLPGEAEFPLNNIFQATGDRNESEQLKQYLTQARMECAKRLVAKVYAGGSASKWWLCFQKRKFMNKSL